MLFLRNGTIPLRISTRLDRKNFKKKSSKFIIGTGRDEGLLLFIKFSLVNLKVFSEDERHHLLDYIRLKHVENGHAGRDSLNSVLKNCLYSYKRDDIMRVLRRCSQCLARNLMTTR